MIHLRLELNDHMESWLKDITNAENKFCFVALRKVAEQWNRPYLDLLSKGELAVGGKMLKMQEVLELEQELKDEENGELVIGEVIADKLQDAYSLVKAISPHIVTMDINDWCREIVKEAIINEKDQQDRQKLREEEEKIS